MTSVQVEVRYKQTQDPDAIIRARMKRIMVESAATLHEVLYEESTIRPDGKGSAVDTGFGSGSIRIIQSSEDKVVVGTNVRYMADLAGGRPDPSASVKSLRAWATRKEVPITPEGINKLVSKLRKVGPIPNPMQRRAANRFIKLFSGILRRTA